MLNGIWYPAPNPPAHLNGPDLNGSYVVEIGRSARLVFDTFLGGPFPITKVERVREGTYKLGYYNYRAGYETIYILREVSGSRAMTIEQETKDDTSNNPSILWYKVPGTENIQPEKTFGLCCYPAFNPTDGVLNDSEVRLREDPSLDSRVLGYLDKGDKVGFLARSASVERIGGMYDYWYEVRTPAGSVGWVYGAFVDLSNPKVENQFGRPDRVQQM